MLKKTSKTKKLVLTKVDVMNLTVRSGVKAGGCGEVVTCGRNTDPIVTWLVCGKKVQE